MINHQHIVCKAGGRVIIATNHIFGRVGPHDPIDGNKLYQEKRKNSDSNPQWNTFVTRKSLDTTNTRTVKLKNRWWDLNGVKKLSRHCH